MLSSRWTGGALKRDGLSANEARDRAHDIHERTWAALSKYRHLDEQCDWWPAFVAKALGHAGAATDVRPALNIFSE